MSHWKAEKVSEIKGLTSVQLELSHERYGEDGKAGKQGKGHSGGELQDHLSGSRYGENRKSDRRCGTKEEVHNCLLPSQKSSQNIQEKQDKGNGPRKVVTLYPKSPTEHENAKRTYISRQITIR